MESKRVRFAALPRNAMRQSLTAEKMPRQRYLDLELRDPDDVFQRIYTQRLAREQENLPSAYVILGMVEYASLQTQGLTQVIEEPGSGKRTILGLTVLVDGMLGVRVIGAPEDAFNELVNSYAK